MNQNNEKDNAAVVEPTDNKESPNTKNEEKEQVHLPSLEFECANNEMDSDRSIEEYEERNIF